MITELQMREKLKLVQGNKGNSYLTQQHSFDYTIPCLQTPPSSSVTTDFTIRIS